MLVGYEGKVINGKPELTEDIDLKQVREEKLIKRGLLQDEYFT